MSTVITESTVYATTVTAPDDADTLNVASIVAPGVGLQPLTDRTNNLVRRCGGANGAGEYQYLDVTGSQTPRPRTRIISPIDFAHGVLQILPDVDEGGANPAVDRAQWFTLSSFVNSFALTSQHDRARIAVDVSKFLDEGATLTLVEALVAPGSARAVLADRMFLDVSSATPNFATPAIPVGVQLANVEDDGLATNQVISSGVLSEVVTRGKYIIVVIRCGTDSGTNKDDIFSIRLSFTAIGPNAF